MMQRLVDDVVQFKVTMSIYADPVRNAYKMNCYASDTYDISDLSIDLAAREQKRNRKHPQLCELAEFYI